MYITQATLVVTGVTSTPLSWGRWTPGCTSYTAAQWGCCPGIDLVDPAEPRPPASPHSSALNVICRREGRAGERGLRKRGRAKKTAEMRNGKAAGEEREKYEGRERPRHQWKCGGEQKIGGGRKGGKKRVKVIITVSFHCRRIIQTYWTTFRRRSWFLRRIQMIYSVTMSALAACTAILRGSWPCSSTSVCDAPLFRKRHTWLGTKIMSFVNITNRIINIKQKDENKCWWADELMDVTFVDFSKQWFQTVWHNSQRLYVIQQQSNKRGCCTTCLENGAILVTSKWFGAGWHMN